MTTLSKRDEALLYMHKMGYEVVNGILYNPKGLVVVGGKSWDGYPIASIRCNGSVFKVKIHRLLGYQLFGDLIFSEDMQVRHLDGNKLNYKDVNIKLGTKSDNQLDKSIESRKSASKKAGSRPYKNKHEGVIARHKEGYTHKQIMEEFGISSRGTVSFIINKSKASKI